MRCVRRWARAMPFERPHHQRVARVLESLDGEQLRQRNCLFAGGTVIALRFGEFRESVDVDFLVSDITQYRDLRLALTGVDGLRAITRAGATPLQHAGEIRADQYGIRTRVLIDGQAIKFEIVHEARISLEPPAADDQVCGVASLTPLDMATSKLLANSDRWADDGVFSRDLIDLAMMQPALPLLRSAVAKAQEAYGAAVLRDLGRAIDRIGQRNGWLERCMQVMAMRDPKALLWQRIRRLRRVLPKAPA
jgi:hypothetical protein